jgi:hypothetical protein
MFKNDMANQKFNLLVRKDSFAPEFPLVWPGNL